jgi:hypothetical protein
MVDISRELKRLEEELYKGEEEIDVSEIKVGRRVLPRIKIGDEVFTFDRENQILRNIKTRIETKLSKDNVENVDFLMETIKKVKERINDMGRINRSISSRLARFAMEEDVELTKARQKLGETGV